MDFIGHRKQLTLTCLGIPKHVLFIYAIVYVSFFSYANGKGYTQDQVCNGTKKTIQIVNTCRMEISRFGKRSREKMCKNFSSCQGEHLVYHCVRYKDKFVEVCAPSVLITGKCCAQYDAGVGRVVEDYNRPSQKLPFQYKSDSFWESSACAETLKTKSSGSVATVNSSQFPQNNDKEHNCDIIFAIVIGIAALTIIMIILLLVVCICCKSCKYISHNAWYMVSHDKPHW